MNRKLDLEREFPGEPRLGIDFDQLVAVGGRQVRRRRNVAVIGAASVAVVIVVGTSLLVPRLREAAGFGGIPGCDTVLGPTNSKQAQTSASAGSAGPMILTSSESAVGSGEPAASVDAQAAARAKEAAAAASAEAKAQTSAEATGSGMVESEAAAEAGAAQQNESPRLALDPAQAPDGLTAAVWGQLSANGATARLDTQFGLPTFHVTGEVRDPNELGWQSSFDSVLDSPLGSGDFSVYVEYDGQSAPPCHEGELDRRVTYPDGTIVDLTSGSNLNYSMDESGSATMTTNQSVHAVGYHPDGTKVIAMSSDSMGFAGQMGVASGATPVSLEFVQQMAADPNLRRSGAGAAAVTETSSKAVVPDVVGLSQDAAALTLDEAFFPSPATPALEEVSDPALVGYVISQSPAAGEVVDAYSEIQLTVGVAEVADSPKVSAPEATVVPSSPTTSEPASAESTPSELTTAELTISESTTAVDTTS